MTFCTVVNFFIFLFDVFYFFSIIRYQIMSNNIIIQINRDLMAIIKFSSSSWF